MRYIRGREWEKIRLHDIVLVRTCTVFSEKYDAFDKATGEQIAYLQLRRGVFTAECPSLQGTLVYSAETIGSRWFWGASERVYHLRRAKQAIAQYFSHQPLHAEGEKCK